MRTDVERKAFYRGVQAACGVVEGFDAYVDHPWRLSDVVRCKLNMMPKRKMRRTPRRRYYEMAAR